MWLWQLIPSLTMHWSSCSHLKPTLDVIRLNNFWKSEDWESVPLLWYASHQLVRRLAFPIFVFLFISLLIHLYFKRNPSLIQYKKHIIWMIMTHSYMFACFLIWNKLKYRITLKITYSELRSSVKWG